LKILNPKQRKSSELSSQESKSLKERTFYTINLDVKRIAILVSILLLLIIYSFMLGHTLGKRKAEKEFSEEREELVSQKPKEARKADLGIDPENGSKKELDRKLLESPKTDAVDPNDGSVIEELPETAEPPISKPKKKKEKPPQSTSDLAPKKIMENEEEPDYFSLQLGAFSSREQALKYKENLLQENKKFKKLNPYIMKNGDLFTVRMGKSLNKDDMEKEKNKLKGDFKKDVMVVRVKQN
jgi:cell division septation protein DedD